MFFLVNYIPKIQAIDKSAAMIAELRRQGHDVFVVNLVGLTETTRGDGADFHHAVLDETGDLTVDLPATAGAAEARDAEWFASISAALEARGGDNAGIRRYVLCPMGGANGPVDRVILDRLATLGFAVIGYCKSIHDEGYGISTMRLTPAGKLKNMLRRLLKGGSAAKAKSGVGELLIADYDRFAAFNDYQGAVLRDRGFNDRQIFLTGYPILYRAWEDMVRGFARPKAADEKVVVVFTRGQKVSKDAEKSVVPNAMAEELLEHILARIDAMPGAKRCIVKPHPFQDIDTVNRSVADYAFAKVSHENPSILCASADLAITTYSSTALDALGLGVPCIEYFYETPYFWKKHPTGSPFPDLGASKARTRDEFEAALDAAWKGELPRPNLSERLGHRTDLSIFTQA